MNAEFSINSKKTNVVTLIARCHFCINSLALFFKIILVFFLIVNYEVF